MKASNNKKAFERFIKNIDEASYLEKKLEDLVAKENEIETIDTDEEAAAYKKIHDERLKVERAYLTKRLEVLSFEEAVNEED